jgi:hypothetical protein
LSALPQGEGSPRNETAIPWFNLAIILIGPWTLGRKEDDQQKAKMLMIICLKSEFFSLQVSLVKNDDSSLSLCQ